MEQVSNAQLMEMMDIVSSSPELRERVSRRIQNNRSCKKAYNAKAYELVKEHRQRITSICQTPAGFGDWGAEMATMSVQKGMEIDFYQPRRSSRGSKYLECLQRKIEAERTRR